MPDIPLNPDALEAAYIAVSDESWLGSTAARSIANAAVTAYLAVAQPEVNTVGELNALPIGTVVYAANNIGPAERFDVGWMGCGNTAAWSSAVLAGDGLPARVLYRPEVKP